MIIDFEYSLYEYNKKREFESLVVDTKINNVLSHFITKIELVLNELSINKEKEQKIVIDFFNKEDDQILVNIYTCILSDEESIIQRNLVHYFIFSKEYNNKQEKINLNKKLDNNLLYMESYKKAKTYFKENADENFHKSIFHFTLLLKSLKNIEKY